MTRPVVHEAAERVYRLLPDYMRAGDDALTGEYVDYFARRTNLVANPSFGVDGSGWSATSETSDDLEAELLLRQAVLWLDAKYATSSQTVPNQGTGGTALDATLGSTGGADSNDPKWLPYEGTPYVYLPGVASNYLSTPDAAALDITGDIDIRVRVALDDWTPAATSALAAKWLAADSAWVLVVNTDGTLAFTWSANGTAIVATAASSVATGITDGAVKWIRATLDVDNGAAGSAVKFYTSDDGTTWTQLGTTVTTAGTTSIYNSSRPVHVGHQTTTSNPATGKFYRAIIKDGIDGTTVLDIDCSVITSGAATSFTATTGQTVTVNRGTAGRKSVAVVAPCWLLGTDDYMEVADNALLDFDADDDFTVLAVVRQWGTWSAAFERIVSQASNVDDGWTLNDSNTPYSIYAAIDQGANRALRNGLSTASAGALAAKGFVVDRSAQTIATFSGGTLSATASTAAVGSIVNALPMRIGADAVGTSYNNMELTAVAVFRSALNPVQISLINDYYQNRL